MENSKIISFLFLFFFVVFSASFSLGAFAQSSEDGLQNNSSSILSAGGIQGESLKVCLDSGCCDLCDFMTVISNIFKFLRNDIAFPLAILIIIYGGLLMIFSGGSTQRSQNGKKFLSSAIIGFAIVFGASLIVNTVMIIISKSPLRVEALMNGQVADMQCTKSCTASSGVGSGSSVTGTNVQLDSRISSMLDQLQQRYNITITSTTDGQHVPGSYHYKGQAADIWTSNKAEWNGIVSYLQQNGYNAFCDNNGQIVSCSQATHIHFDLKGR